MGTVSKLSLAEKNLFTGGLDGSDSFLVFDGSKVRRSFCWSNAAVRAAQSIALPLLWRVAW